MNVCAMPPIVVYERHKDRNVIAFAVLCRQEPKIADTNHPNGAGSKVLNSYGALRTFMQNNPLLTRSQSPPDLEVTRDLSTKKNSNEDIQK